MYLHVCIMLISGGMRDRTPNMEVNSVDEETLNVQVSTALRAYLPLHFPSLIPSSATRDAMNDSLPNPEIINSTVLDITVDCVTNLLKIEHEWIGIMGFSRDRNPLIGPLKSRPGEFIAAGYTGHGMPVAFLAGRNIAEMIYGVKSEIPVPSAYLPCRFGL